MVKQSVPITLNCKDISFFILIIKFLVIKYRNEYHQLRHYAALIHSNKNFIIILKQGKRN